MVESNLITCIFGPQNLSSLEEELCHKLLFGNPIRCHTLVG